MANYDSDARVWFDLVNGAVGSTTGFASGAISGPDANGFYRCEARGFSTVTDVSGSALVGLSDANSSLVSTVGRTAEVKEAQLETGSTATAYQRVGTAFDVTEAGVASRSYLSFDGTDDGMLTGNIVPGTDKAQVFAGVRKLSDASFAGIVELSANVGANDGSFVLSAPPLGGQPTFGMTVRGTATVFAAANNAIYAAPTTRVQTGIAEIGTDTLLVRLDGVQAATSASDQGTGNFLTYPLYIGRRGGTSSPFNGQIFGLILRFGTNLSAATVTQTETWLANRAAPTVVIP
jgi:hypothetical protein